MSKAPDASKKKKKQPAFPSKDQLLDFVREQKGKVGKREIARAFGLKGPDKIRLKALLRELAGAGEVERGRGRRLVQGGELPEVVLLDIADTDLDGELVARPANWRTEDAPPRVLMAPVGPGQPALATGDRVLARVGKIRDGVYQGKLIRRLQAAPEHIVGVYRHLGRDGRIEPADKRTRDELVVDIPHSQGALSGEVVLAEALPGRTHGLRRARILQRLGRIGEARSLSLMAVHQHGIPTRFPEEALAEAEAAKAVRIGKREDLRALPLVTIDPEDARDHDDAVFAEPDTSPRNEGGWHVVVAIADVSWYVRPGSALDREARRRGNSVYFPDRVVPMLPEKLSADLCSLVAGKSRACIAVHMWFDREGRKIRHRFARALMKSKASLEYGQVQRAIDGAPDRAAASLMEEVIRPLYGAYEAVCRAREKRQPLAIDLPERKIVLGEDGFIEAVRPRERFESHRLIEEFMILANVCAAETLEGFRQPCMYRVHEPPSLDKLEALRQFLDTLGLKLARGQNLKPQHFNQILSRAASTPQAQLVNEVILRSQMQAIYSPDNLGHFGLNLARYAHFTSPIRRYADLLVHRALVSGGGFGEGGLSEFDRTHFEETAGLISQAERRAMVAERDALDRFAAAFLAERIGATFRGRVSGVTRFGLFVKLDETGADGLVPVSSLPGDFYVHDEGHHALVGQRTGIVHQLGDQVEVRLAEAAPVSGGLRFELLPGQGRAASQEERRRLRSAPKRPRRHGRHGR
ncbi:MAG: ribonuclease R [Alphaproteobacteria bacterium]|nr:ribonuclease R [Alphaproteobacteria bacterium]